MAVILGAASPSLADDAALPAALWQEVWAGADLSASASSVYAGLTTAPLGSIADDGLRLRVGGGYGRYRYAGAGETEHRATVAFSDFLLGYHAQLGPLTVKAFGGYAAITHAITPFDIGNEVVGFRYGPKAALETWLNIGPVAWASLDVNATKAHDSYGTRFRIGYRLSSDWSAGIETGLAGNRAGDTAKGGLFTRYEWATGEISLSGGFAASWDEADHAFASDNAGAYVTVNWLVKY